MDIGRAIKRRVRAAAAPSFFLALVAYFGWNVTSGPHGLLADRERHQQLARAQQELAQAEASRDDWENRVRSLQADHINADMLDEQSREMLNLSASSDIILMYREDDKLY